jgi:integrase
MARRRLTDKGVAALRPRSSRYTHPDVELPGHYVRVQPTGGKSFVAVALDPAGKQVWATVGNAAHLSIEEARAKARVAIAAIKAGEDRTGPESFHAVADAWLRRHVEARGLRSQTEIHRYLNKHILPTWSRRPFRSIRRGDVAKLLDQIEDGAGPVAADFALSIVRNIGNWYQSRHDDYVSPVVKGMRRSTPKERARDRILTDDETRLVWKVAGESGTFGALVKLLLLTGQRREKVASMRWDDVSIDGTWTIPAEDREKGNALELVLPGIALDIVRAQPRFANNPFVFAGRGGSYLNGYSKAKAALDAKVRIPEWRLHDLRRTARSLMARAGVSSEVAERVLGHALPGLEQTYNRHEYRAEKADALRKLAGVVESIMSTGTVVRMAR